MFKLKAGAVINPHGAGSLIDEKTTNISQEILAHLKTRFPALIEGEFEEHKPATKTSDLTKEQIVLLLEKKANKTATDDEIKIISQAKQDGKI